MRTTRIGGEERRIDANAFTSIVYERSFGTNHKLDEDVNALLNARLGPLTLPPIDAALRLEYAFERSVGAGAFPDYDHWIRSFPKSELDQTSSQNEGGWVSNIFDEVVATFFPRYAAANVGTEGDGGRGTTPSGTGGETSDVPALEGA